MFESDVRFMSRAAAEQMAASPGTVAVSIFEPGSEPACLREGFRDVLRVAFWDVVDPIEQAGIRYEPITPEIASMIVGWLDGWDEHPDSVRLIVHCRAGVSRSAAVARFAAERYGLDIRGDTRFANIEVLRQLRRAAWLVPAGGE